MWNRIESRILQSSVMNLDLVSRYVWFCLLALMDQNGIINVTDRNALAVIMRIDHNDLDHALDQLIKPDPQSRTKTDGGRRLEQVPGGWRVINKKAVDARLSNVERQRAFRQREKEKQIAVARQYHDVRKRNARVTAVTNTDTDTDINNMITSATPTRASEGFAKFWAAYPRKQAKAVAAKRWAQLRPSASEVDLMLAVIEAQSQTDQWQRGIIPHAATWLNQRRWEDEIVTAAPRSGGLDAAAEKTRRLLAERQAALGGDQ